MSSPIRSTWRTCRARSTTPSSTRGSTPTGCCAPWAKVAGRFREALRTVGKPTIAKIRGYCVGGGLGIALNCDLRITAEDGQFGIPAAKLGIGYAAEAVGMLVNLVGPSAAKDIL